MSQQRGKARIVLPRPPRGASYDALRKELQQHNLHLTILGLRPDGRPTIKVVGPREALRRWLDGAGFDCVGIE